MRKLLIVILTAALLPFAGCEKSEGEGGRASIIGKIIVQKRERIQNSIIAEYPAMEERVYIVYGNSETVVADDDTRTSYDGYYEFNYLFPGDYKIYVYSECRQCPEEVEPIIKEIKIGKAQNDVEVEDIYITVY